MNELTLNLTDAAEQINHHHRLATDHATKAVSHAVTIGNLLLEVKERLPHGAYTPWIENNLEVSPRQARRYVDAALGKAISPRQIKSDTVSVLDQLPEPGNLLLANLRGNADDEIEDHAFVAIQESGRNPGYYDFLFIDGSMAHFQNRPMKPEFLGLALEMILPGQFLNIGIDRFNWQQEPIQHGGIEDIVEGWRVSS